MSDVEIRDEILNRNREHLVRFIEEALREDIGEGDHSSLACFSSEDQGTAVLTAKEAGIWAGNPMIQLIASRFDSDLTCRFFFSDGDAIKKGDVLYELNGAVRSILSTERVMLNTVQHLSGVATATHSMASIIEDLGTRLLDTRKTTPGMRVLEKWAVQMGGGKNHRMGLYDMIMIKDNHIDRAGTISKAVERVSEYLRNQGKPLKIEVETRTIEEVEEALSLSQVDWIMLDNFSPEEVAKAVALIGKRKITEASGGIDEHNIREYAKAGVDFISSGAITQKARPLDLSLGMR